jgi:cell division protein FtsW
MAFFNPEAYSQDVAYQVVQSSIAIGSGGVTGTGVGQGKQQLGYLIEGHSDFILACIGEELGFVGVCAVLVLFLMVLWRGVRAAIGARDAFGRYLAYGITVMMAMQALVHMGVVLDALPAKGLTLPLVSYGGSSLVMTLFLFGVLFNIGMRRQSVPRGRELVQSGGRKRRQRAIIVCDS